MALTRRAIKSILDADPKNHYAVMGLEPSCSDADIRAEYKSLSQAIHPDKTNEPGAQAAFAKLNGAKTVLLDPRARREYDRENYSLANAPENALVPVAAGGAIVAAKPRERSKSPPRRRTESVKVRGTTHTVGKDAAPPKVDVTIQHTESKGGTKRKSIKVHVGGGGKPEKKSGGCCVVC
mmetsp:Transcript_24599/g.73847  ORF Transcript_24599/g.73847 Transcript_24599/m.73847 type:complete len:180 (+) Transcript_24599:335-874(+)